MMNSLGHPLTGTQFHVSTVSSEEVGWRGKLSKWQWALVIGLPLAAVAAVAGLTLIIRRRRRRDSGREITPPPSMSSTPVASPISTTVKTNQEPSDKDRALELKQQGNSLFKQGRLEEAARCYEEAIQLSVGTEVKDNFVATCHQNLAAVYDEMVKRDTDPDQRTSHRELVIENCDRAIALDPRYMKALLRRFKMHLALGHQEEALLDVTRVLLLDESHAQSLSTSVTTLLRDLSQTAAAKTFPMLEPLAPTKYLVKTYCESYIWKDDLSEARLKALWLQTHSPPTDQSETATVSSDTSWENPVQEMVQNDMGKGGNREEGGGEGGEGGGEGGVEGGEGGVLGAGEEREQQAENGAPEEEVAVMAGFAKEPFVQAAAQFQHYDLTGILDLLTQAIDRGHAVFKPHAVLLRGTLHALWRMEQEALRDLQEIVNTRGLSNEMYVNALIKRAGIFAGQQNVDKCKTCLEKARVLSPHSVDILVHSARVSLETEDMTNLQSVISDLSEAVRAAPDQPYPLYSLASSYHRLASINQSMQLIESARTKFQEALKKFPKFADGLILYALFLQDINDFQQAEQILNKVVQIEPDNPLGHFSLGLLQLVVRSDLNQTMVHMQKAIAVDISCVQAYDTIASIEMQRGNTTKAVELYEKAVRYSRNQVEMTQAYVAQKVFSTQDRVCKEYGVSIQQLAARGLTTGSPPT